MRIKNVLTFLFAAILFGCNHANNASNKTEDTSIKESHEHDNEKEHGGNLALNNGAKWQTDVSTHTHAVKLITQADTFDTKTDEDVTLYHSVAADMQKELNSLVGDCKMKGPDHDALHLWLEPVLKDVSDLKKISATEEGKHAAEKLTGDVKKFNQYFN